MGVGKANWPAIMSTLFSIRASCIYCKHTFCHFWWYRLLGLEIDWAAHVCNLAHLREDAHSNLGWRKRGEKHVFKSSMTAATFLQGCHKKWQHFWGEKLQHLATLQNLTTFRSFDSVLNDVLCKRSGCSHSERLPFLICKPEICITEDHIRSKAGCNFLSSAAKLHILLQQILSKSTLTNQIYTKTAAVDWAVLTYRTVTLLVGC